MNELARIASVVTGVAHVYRLWFLSVLACLVLSACSAQHTDLVQSGYLNVDSANATALAHAPEAREVDGGVLVEGWLDTDEAARGSQVDISVVSSDGTVVQHAVAKVKAAAADAPKSAWRQRRGPRTTSESHATYSVLLPGLPPPGSVLKARLDPAPAQSPLPNKEQP